MVDTIYTLSNSLILYTNNSSAYIEFDLCTELAAEDDRELEALIVNSKTLAVNETNITEPYKVLLTMREVTEEDRDMLAAAYDIQDKSGILTITQSNSDSSIVKTITYTSIVPTKNQNFNFMLAESIKSKTVNVVFQGLKPEIRYG